MRCARVAVAALVVGGVLGGCAREPTTDSSSVVSPAPSSGTAAGVAGSSARSTVPTRTIAITVRGRQASGETGRVSVPLGTVVSLAVTSDVGDEIHVHGYDRKAEIPPGGTASMSFMANVAGVFEVELEDSKLQLLQLQVS
ncbi:MAG: hypothetical protein JO287_02125 [Pseudonocardiales bacterium]|nr:hypothetical protein [Pseudonocardiales bacterium]